MKSPLSYQVSEYDCGTISLLNALNFMLEREQIPIELVKLIFLITLDACGETGKIGENGTSQEAMRHISILLKEGFYRHQLKMDCNYLEKEQVSFETIQRCLQQNGCIVLRTFFTTDHYVLLTKIDSAFVSLFDSYYSSEEESETDAPIKTIQQEMFLRNKKVPLSYFFQEEKRDFTLGPMDLREGIFFDHS